MPLGHVTDNHARMHQSFRWWVPDTFNIAQVCVRRWAASAAHAQNPAIVCHDLDPTQIRTVSFQQLQQLVINP